MGISVRSFITGFLFFSLSVLNAQAFTREYKIALVLPFNSFGTQNSLTDAMLDYYEGFKMAAKDLESEGLKLKLYVYDCSKDSQYIETVFRHPDMRKMDVIIGPVYDENLRFAEEFCKKHNILLVSPLKFYVPQNPGSRVINFFVPDSLRCVSIAEKSVRYFPGYRFAIVGDNSSESNSQTAIIKKRITELTGKSVKVLSYSAGALSTKLTQDSLILISTITSKDAKSVIHKAVKALPHAYAIAQMNWYNPSQSTYGQNEPKMIYPEVNFVSYGDSFATRFRSRFFEQYYGEPSKYAYIAYDQATYICYGLMTFGKTFDKHLPDAEFRGLINVIRLKKHSTGIVNIGLNYIRIIEETKQEFAP